MKSLALKIRGFLGSEDGATAVEYAIMVALIAAVVIGTVTALGTNADATFQSAADALAATGTP